MFRGAGVLVFVVSAALAGCLEIPLCKAAGLPWLNYAWLLGWFSWLCIALLVVSVLAALGLPHGWRLVGVPTWLLLEDLTAHLFLGGYALGDWSHLGFLPLLYYPNWFWWVVGALLLAGLIAQRRRNTASRELAGIDYD